MAEGHLDEIGHGESVRMDGNSNDAYRAATLTNKYKPYLAYKPSGVEWLGEIPAHWEVRRLKSFASVRLSNVDKKSEEGQAAVGLCNYVDVYYNERISPDVEFMAATASEDQIRRFSLHKGDVLITKDSESWTDIAVPAVVTQDLPDVLCGYHLAHIRPSSNCDGAFLSRAFSAVGPRNQYEISANGVTRFGLTGDAIRAGVFPLPPLPEQQAIAAFLDRETARIDALVSRKERLIDLLREKRAALITRAVTKGLDPDAPMKDSGVEWLGEIPAHWDVKRLKEVGEALIGLTYSPDDVVVGQNDGSLVLRASNISEGKIVLEDNVYVGCPVAEKLVTRERDILICSRSGSRGLIGKNAIIDSDSSGMTFGAFMTVYRSTRNEYLHHVFNSALFEFQSGMFMTSTINQLTLGMLNGFYVSVPPTNEQTAIATFLDQETAKLDNLVAKVREAIECLRELRAALISAAVTGRIDVREEAGCK